VRAFFISFHEINIKALLVKTPKEYSMTIRINGKKASKLDFEALKKNVEQGKDKIISIKKNQRSISIKTI
jgi:hypothetical protein